MRACPDFEQRVAQLTTPAPYPHPVSLITTIETHISVVFLTGQYAYKLKKPVDFGFLDFSSRQNRRTFCQMELTLNQRTAPQLYLDVCALTLEDDGQVQIQPLQPSHQGKGIVCDYLVKMQQFDPNQVLRQQIHQLSDPPTMAQSLATEIAQLHLHAETCPPALPYGHPDDLIHPMLDNFSSLLQGLSHPEDQYRLHQLAQWTRAQHQALWQSLLQRKHTGWIRACHGDLHLDNIALLWDQQPVLFDGIEFNEQLRWIDPINDLAFLLVDLSHQQQDAMKNHLLTAYLQKTGDYEAMALLDFYQVYRAMVRAKIAWLRAAQLDATTDQAQKAKAAKASAQAYLTQAQTHAYRSTPSQLIVMQGISGSGKSTFARTLLDQLSSLSPEVPTVIVSSDIERKRLFELAPDHRPSQRMKKKLYNAQANQATHQRLHAATQALLAAGCHVIVDATHLKAQHRKPLQTIAAQHQAWYKVCALQVSDEAAMKAIDQRLAIRQAQSKGPSDADAQVARAQRPYWQTPHHDETPLILDWHQVAPSPLPQETAQAVMTWLKSAPATSST